MKRVLAAAAVLAGALGSAHAQDQELVSNPRGMMSNFDISSIGPILTEMGATWQEMKSEDGQPYVAVNVGGGLAMIIAPMACAGANYTSCIGMNTISFFQGVSMNYQTVAAFNQRFAFTSAYISQEGDVAFLSRYDIADYGIPRGNVASSLANFVALADRFRQELATAGRTVSLEGYPQDMSARFLNSKGFELLSGEKPLEPLTLHQAAIEESTELALKLVSSASTPRNKIENFTAKKK